MHNAAFEILGLDFIYLPFEVKPADLEIAVKAIKVLGFKGVNVTVPHKEKVVKYLDKLDSSAKEVGAVNTISNENGKLIGYNTDGIGFLKSLAGKINLKNKNVLLLGCGGAGKAIACALAKSKVGSLTIIDSNKEKAKETKLLVEKMCKVYGVRCRVAISDQRSAIGHEVDFLINATPLGMHPGDLLPIGITRYHCVGDRGSIFVYDIVYNRETELLQEAKRIGAKTLGGLEMLIHQGAEAFRIWTGREAPIGVMRRAIAKKNHK
jgi:shikimate dehydrogenase